MVPGPLATSVLHTKNLQTIGVGGGGWLQLVSLFSSLGPAKHRKVWSEFSMVQQMKSFISYKQPMISPDLPIATVPQGIVGPGKAVTEVRRKGSAGQRKGE